MESVNWYEIGILLAPALCAMGAFIPWLRSEVRASRKAQEERHDMSEAIRLLTEAQTAATDKFRRIFDDVSCIQQDIAAIKATVKARTE